MRRFRARCRATFVLSLAPCWVPATWRNCTRNAAARTLSRRVRSSTPVWINATAPNHVKKTIRTGVRHAGSIPADSAQTRAVRDSYFLGTICDGGSRIFWHRCLLSLRSSSVRLVCHRNHKTTLCSIEFECEGLETRSHTQSRHVCTDAIQPRCILRTRVGCFIVFT